MRREHLDRYAAFQLGIEPLQDDPHAAPADDLQHVVAAEPAQHAGLVGRLQVFDSEIDLRPFVTRKRVPRRQGIVEFVALEHRRRLPTPGFAAGQHVQQRLQVATACRHSPPRALSQPTDGQVADYSPQPTAKRAVLFFGFPAVDAPADGQQQFLHHVPGVGVLEPALPQRAVDHGFIKVDELDPGFVIFRITKAEQQAGAGGRGDWHRRRPLPFNR